MRIYGTANPMFWLILFPLFSFVNFCFFCFPLFLLSLGTAGASGGGREAAAPGGGLGTGWKPRGVVAAEPEMHKSTAKMHTFRPSISILKNPASQIAVSDQKWG